MNGGERRERAVAVPAATAFDVANQMLSWIGEQVVFARVGDVVVVTFGVMAGIGTLLAFTWMSVLWVGQGLSARHLLGIGLEGGVLTLVGSWLAAVLLDYRLLVTRPLEALRRPAFVSWGGILGALLALAVGAVWANFDVLLLLDGFARGAPLGHAIGRIGCLTYGCCFGRETRGRLAITYTHPQSKAVRVGLLHGVRLHPAPLYEAVLHLVLFSVLNAAALLGAPRGLPAALCLRRLRTRPLRDRVLARQQRPHAAALPGGEPGDLARHGGGRRGRVAADPRVRAGGAADRVGGGARGGGTAVGRSDGRVRADRRGLRAAAQACRILVVRAPRAQQEEE